MNKTILIVEDEESVLIALKDKLILEGFTVIEAKNGEEGLSSALSQHPDLILLDIVLPKMDGMSVLKKLREDSWGKSALVIVLTNLSDTEKVSEALKNQAMTYLIKSDWDLDEVIGKIKEKLKLAQNRT